MVDSGLEPNEHIDRRSFFKRWIGAISLAHLGALASISSFALTVYREIRNHTDPHIQTLDVLEDLFVDWGRYTLLPGSANVDFRAEVHPDIIQACRAIEPLWRRPGRPVEYRSAEQLHPATKSDSLFLIGGPVSNAWAQEWQGYTRDSDGYLHRTHPPSLDLRWYFKYALAEPKWSGPLRYVDGILKPSWPQAIVDTSSGDLIRPSTMGPSRMLPNLPLPVKMLRTDWMVMSYLPNTLDTSSNTDIIDISDFHGQGDKALGLLHNPPRLNQLLREVRASGATRYFQALFEIPVKHDEDPRSPAPSSRPQRIVLRGVHPIRHA